MSAMNYSLAKPGSDALVGAALSLAHAAMYGGRSITGGHLVGDHGPAFEELGQPYTRAAVPNLPLGASDDPVCGNHDPELWFATDTKSQITAAELCDTCPVRAKCARHGLANEEYGIWGGINVSTGLVPNLCANGHRGPWIFQARPFAPAICEACADEEVLDLAA